MVTRVAAQDLVVRARTQHHAAIRTGVAKELLAGSDNLLACGNHRERERESTVCQEER